MTNEHHKQICFWLNALKIECGQWSEKTFPKSTVFSIMNHLDEEMTELNCAVKFCPDDKISEEMADCFLLLIHLSHKCDVDIGASILKKFEVNKFREWYTEPNEKGYFKHIKKGPQNENK